MSEIKTLKCDICGEVYHYDEKETSLFIVSKEHGEYIKKYEDICPVCTCNIVKLIEKPSLLDEILDKKCRYKSHFLNMECAIKKLRDDVIGWKPFSLVNDDDLYARDMYFENMTKEIEDTYAKTLKSRTIWFRVSFILLGLIIGNVIATLI